MPLESPPTRKHYTVVVDVLDDRDGRATGRVGRSVVRATEARAKVVAYLTGQGVGASDYAMGSPSAVGTFGLQASEVVAKLVRAAPGVTAVLEG